MSGEWPLLPDGLEYVRTTAVFDQEDHPKGLLRAHRVAEGVWARLVVHTGELGFVFEDHAEHPRRISAGDHVVIPPQRLHHVVIDGAVTFSIEFHREAVAPSPAEGAESSGLAPN
jgi:tellurite resistance-related uncharacterized protein